MLNWISFIVKLDFFLNLIVWYKLGFMVLTWTSGIDLDSWYRGLKVQTWTYGIDMDSWYIHGLMVQTWTHGIDKDSWYRYRLMVLTTPMLLTQTHGIESVLLNHTRTRGPSVTRMRDFLFNYLLLLKCIIDKIPNVSLLQV